MSSEQALEELKKYAQEFAAVGDAKEAIAADKAGFLHKWTKVMQYYRHICRQEKGVTMLFLDAVDVVDDIKYDNPSLEDWVMQIISPPQNTKEKTTSQSSPSIDTSALASRVDSYVTEVRTMQSWDPERIGDIAWQLEECQKTLLANQSSFSPQLFDSLMADINASLDKIGRFNNMLNSDVMEGISRM